VTQPDVLLGALAAPVCAATGYLAFLAALSRTTSPPTRGPRRQRFDVIVPAHDEAGGIAATIASLAALDYPRELYRILVVADNCTDATADVARAAGATVLVRGDTSRRGKGYALTHAFGRILTEGRTDAVVVVDADTVVSRNLLGAFADRLDTGATAVQADYAIRNPDASWRTSLLAIAFASIHGLRSRGRERLHLSCGLRGNGMCFSAALLGAVPYDAVSIVEDVEYSIRLGLAGVRVAYAAEAHVYGEMPATERDSRTQRRRWEAGRAEMLRLHAPRLLARGLKMRQRLALDLAADLLVPPLATVAIATAAGLIVAALVSYAAGRVTPGSWVWVACALGLSMYVLRGWQLSGTGSRGLFSLVFAPLYVAWKVALILVPSAQPKGEWIRTTREGERRS
jgi:cellulose synthase/poly-beta-1,6-N-acetylglucosamine synthase-like glycosyltransferase